MTATQILCDRCHQPLGQRGSQPARKLKDSQDPRERVYVHPACLAEPPATNNAPIILMPDRRLWRLRR